MSLEQVYRSCSSFINLRTSSSMSIDMFSHKSLGSNSGNRNSAVLINLRSLLWHFVSFEIWSNEWIDVFSWLKPALIRDSLVRSDFAFRVWGGQESSRGGLLRIFLRIFLEFSSCFSSDLIFSMQKLRMVSMELLKDLKLGFSFEGCGVACLIKNSKSSRTTSDWRNLIGVQMFSVQMSLVSRCMWILN